MQRAAQFLGPEGKGLWLEAALDASSAARVASSDSAGDKNKTQASSSYLPLRKSSRAILQMLIHRAQYRMRMAALNMTSCVQTRRESNRSSTTPQQLHKVTSPANSLWRPWPWSTCSGFKNWTFKSSNMLINIQTPACIFESQFPVQYIVFSVNSDKSVDILHLLWQHAVTCPESFMTYFCTLIYFICLFLNKHIEN